ncbi:DUF6114 domain-containing protein [Streptomyces sp. RFCAC02]|uniref:DUF6114 domain-containing protein n=1 Tax=Streptomyces sp. RFCAC02 TaxID=2499143 RepID=UPI001F10AF4F|nr:DUF6114 domain-containing protein [Streptomyces sp. RFCAC02]
MSVNTEERAGVSAIAGGRVAFRNFRWSRPFWAGLFVMVAGGPILWMPYANLTIGQLNVRLATTAGASSAVIGILLVVLGLTIWFQPHVRIFAGVAAILLSLVSLVVANFGGGFIGFLLGLVGGAMSVAWVPGTAAPAAGSGAGGAAGSAGGEGETARPAGARGTGSALAAFGGTAPGRDTESGKEGEGAD